MNKKNNFVQQPNIICNNCETRFVGNYCPNCGQSTKDYEKPIGFLIYDFMGNIFAFDTRLWKTLKTILFKPGKMEKEFIMGHRVRYMPPFRFYIFVSFVFFLLLNSKANKDIKDGRGIITFDTTQTTPTIDTSLIPPLVIAGDSINSAINNISDLPNIDKELVKTLNDSLMNQKKDADNTEEIEKLKEIKSNPQTFTASFFKYISWFLFILMPAYALFLWLFFRKTHKYFIGHLIFAIDQHSFLFVILSVLLIINLIFPDKPSSYESLLVLIVPVYSLIGARKLYHKGWGNTFLKLSVIFLMYATLLVTATILAALVVFLI